MRELEKPLKVLDSVIAKIKDIDCKVKEKVKAIVLTESTKALMAKMPDTSKTTIKHILNVQKTVVEGSKTRHFENGISNLI
ncbi:hypothetical protein DSO57_1015631 [Entomophthora muscae]|uniref:Uncharacterized protein n=1 Tax=Entomophthora muscae TaxID=34485 RepID=A0ACC2U3C8_9FUNG|nr:hypothetical protein DSO57_1015631 [Entomophthora muscae]